MRRRSFLALAAAAAASAKPVTRKAAWRKRFDSPGPQPNGMQATAAGLWILDQHDGKAFLVSPETGMVLRTLATECDRGSGITWDGEALWLSSTYSATILKVDARSGATLASHPCPGAGPVRWAYIRQTGAAKGAGHRQVNAVSGLAGPTAITGSHGLEWRDGKLWVATPPSQTVYRIDPANHFMVEHLFAAPGDRPHGIGWEGAALWVADSNQGAFFKADAETGQYSEVLQLGDAAPTPHGMTILGGTLWYCDADSGAVCSLNLRG